MERETTYLPQQVNFLGFLGTQLRDLHSISTLTYELIQNADDVKDDEGSPGTTMISFDVTDEALIVENDGIFRQIDFDRLRNVASGNKRDEIDTTGAFGIGFISVYQVTDYPELYSSGFHWKIRPDAETNERIEVHQVPTENTKFILPWASDPDSSVRQKLKAQSVELNQLNRDADRIAQAIELAALFLKQLQMLEVKRSGITVRRINRSFEEEENQILIQKGNDVLIWQVFEGDFDETAEKLRRRYPRQIEDIRRSRVRIAIPDEGLTKRGRLFATLPSETSIPLPFHIDADFFPTTDRKHIPFDSSYQAEWNRAAIECAAQILADNFHELPGLLNPQEFWQLINQVNATRLQAEKEEEELDATFAAFWNYLLPKLRSEAIIYTSTGKWVKASEARLLKSDAELEAAPVLEALGIAIIHPDLRPYFTLMSQKEIGVPLLSVDDIVSAIRTAALREGPLSAAPDALQAVDSWHLLWSALDAILERSKSAETKTLLIEKLRRIPIALTNQNQLRKPLRVFWADATTRQVFDNIPWLLDELPRETVPGILTTIFDVQVAIPGLSRLTREKLEAEWRDGRLEIPSLFSWFDRHRTDLLDYRDLVKQLKKIPLCPVGERLYPLNDLYLPGGFVDPLGLSLFVDTDSIGGHTSLLRDLGVLELDFETYVREQVPAILESNLDLPSDVRHQLVHLLATRLSEIKKPNILCLLRDLPLIGCTDGQSRPATEVYALAHIRNLLGPGTHIAVPPATDSIQDLYDWLGIQNEPRIKHLLARVDQLTSIPPSSGSILHMENIFGYLADNWLNWPSNNHYQYRALRDKAWLPGTRSEEKWFRPGDLYAVFQQYLFESQANFLDLPRPLQDRGARRRSGFLEYLGVHDVPDPDQVVRHLIVSSCRNEPINREVYRYLNDNVGDSDVDMLVGKPCLLLEEDHYVSADEVYWTEHPFGRFRYQLSTDLRQYGDLFEKLGVREGPDLSDYVDVLLAISDEYAAKNRPLEQETLAVVMNCWEALSRALEQEQIDADYLQPLVTKKVIPDDRESPLLNLPEHMFFEDRAGLEKRFEGSLDQNVLTRPQHAWRAMHAAGVRFLSHVVDVEFLDKADATPDEELLNHLYLRRPLLERVIESEKADSTEIFDSSVLDSLNCQHTPRLVIRYQFTPFSHPIITEPEEASAIWHTATQTLYTTSKNGVAHDWISIARELANAVKQAREIGSLAMAFKEILSTEKIADVERVLDELGYPPLDGEKEYHLSPASVTGLGGEEKPPEADDVDIDDPIAAILDGGGEYRGDITPDMEPAPDWPASKPPRDFTGKETSTGNGDLPGIASDDGQGEPIETGKPADSGEEPKPEPKPVNREGAMLISYVIPVGSGGKGGGKAAQTRTKSDRAGVARVLAYELARDRDPVEMPHHNEGYDVLSTDTEGNERYIEVKSFKSHWSRQSPARITAAQYEFAREKGEQFWLYIVEKAQSDEEFQIYRIHNPAAMIDRYAFDYGWRDFAVEEEEIAEPELHLDLFGEETDDQD